MPTRSSEALATMFTSWITRAILLLEMRAKEQTSQRRDRFSGCEQTSGAEKKDRPLPTRRPMRYMGALQVYGRFRRRRRDHGARQAARSVLETEGIGNVELMNQICSRHALITVA